VNVPANAKNALSQPTPFSSSSNSKIGGSFKDAHQGNAPVGPTDTPGEHASSLSQPYSRPGGLQQDAQSNFPSAVAHILNIQQTSTAGHVERANFPPVSRPETALLETSHPEPGFNGKSKALSLENFISKPRPKPQVNFLIVMREPRDTTMFWPEGQIQGTSLSSFFAGVAKATQRGGIEKLELTLKTATSDTKVPVAKDDEDSWLVAKSLFAEKLKAARMKAKSKGVNENANSQIYIEPFYGQIGSVDGVQEEDEEDDEEISF
jgi:hypothetical protein